MKNKILNVLQLTLIVFFMNSCSVQLNHWKGRNHENLVTNFEKVKGGEWFENNSNGEYYFKELEIQGRRVLLQSLDRDGVYVKLTPRKCLYKNTKNTNWFLIYYGKWIN